MKHFNHILTALLILAIGYIAGYMLASREYISKVKEPVVIESVNEVFIHDTITDVQLVQREIVRHDTVLLHSVDTVYVEVPISKYTFDTLTDDEVHVKGVVSGFNVSMDTLEIQSKEVSYNYHIIQPPLVEEKRKKMHCGFGFALGWGFIYGR